MEIHKILLGLLVFSLFIVIGSLIWGDFISNYEINTTTEALGANFSDVYDVIDETYDISSGSKEHIMEGDLEGEDESWESMVKGSYSAVRLMKDSFALVGIILQSVADTLKIPQGIIKVATIAFAIVIVFSIIYMVFRFKG